MTRVIGWAAAATVAEVLGVLGVVHTLLRHAMTARGLPVWRVADTLLTSPLLWIGVAVFAVAANRLIAVAGLRADRGAAGVAATVLVAVVAAVVAGFGLRAVGKLY